MGFYTQIALELALPNRVISAEIDMISLSHIILALANAIKAQQLSLLRDSHRHSIGRALQHTVSIAVDYLMLGQLLRDAKPVFLSVFT